MKYFKFFAQSECWQHLRVLFDCEIWMYKLEMNGIRGTDCNQFNLVQEEIWYVCKKRDLFTLHMFYRKIVWYYIHLNSELEISIPGKWNNCRLNLVSGRQWLFQVVPFGICTLVTAILILILANLDITFREAV